MGCLLDNVLRVLLTLLSSPVVVLLKHSWILLGWAPRWSFDIDEMQPLMSGSHLFSKRPFLCWTFALFWKPELGSPFYLDISKGGRDRPTKILYFPPSLFLSGEMLVEVVEAKVSYRKEWGVCPPPPFLVNTWTFPEGFYPLQTLRLTSFIILFCFTIASAVVVWFFSACRVPLLSQLTERGWLVWNVSLQHFVFHME